MIRHAVPITVSNGSNTSMHKSMQIWVGDCYTNTAIAWPLLLGETMSRQLRTEQTHQLLQSCAVHQVVQCASVLWLLSPALPRILTVAAAHSSRMTGSLKPSNKMAKNDLGGTCL